MGAFASVAAVHRILIAPGVGPKNAPEAFVVRFSGSEVEDVAPDPLVVAAKDAEEAAEKAHSALRHGYPYLSAGDDPLLFWMQAREALRAMIVIERSRAPGGRSAQMRRLQRAKAIDRDLAALNDAFAPPKLTKKSLARIARGELDGLTYEPGVAPLEELDYAYAEDGRRAALLVAGVPYQPIDVVGLTLEFAACLREAQLHEARLLGKPKPNLAASPVSAATAALPPVAAAAAIEALWVDAKQAARRLGLSTSYLAQLRLRGGGPPFSKHGRAVRYALHELNKWAASRTQISTSDVAHAR